MMMYIIRHELSEADTDSVSVEEKPTANSEGLLSSSEMILLVPSMKVTLRKS